MKEFHYVDDTIDYYYYINSYGDAVRHGPYIHKSCTGGMLIRTNYLHGRQHGEYKSWYESGRETPPQLAMHSHYKHGKQHGEVKIWYPTGELYTHTFYFEGHNHGEYFGQHDINAPPIHFLVIMGTWIPYIEMNTREKLLFQIQHPTFRFLE